MSGRPLTVAVTGLNATDNPAPGMAIVQSLRAEPSFDGRIVGLAYDSLDPGIYATDLVDDVFMIPYPSQGIEPLEARLRHVHEQVGLDVIVPNLDSELPNFISLAPTLREWGVGTFLPSREQFDLRSKAHLAHLGERTDIATPKTRVLAAPEELDDLHEEIPYPYWIKGAFYGAMKARAIDEARVAYHATVAKWGLPIIAQAGVDGDEIDVVAVGDGEGGMVGAVAMRKTFLTDKGKGWAGVAIRDPEIEALVERFFARTKWRGPCEIEMMKERSGALQLLEINPRFPAWTYLSAGAGMNLPWAVVQLAAGRSVEPLRYYRVGTMFVRIALDQIASIEDFEAITTTGEIRRTR